MDTSSIYTTHEQDRSRCCGYQTLVAVVVHLSPPSTLLCSSDYVRKYTGTSISCTGREGNNRKHSPLNCCDLVYAAAAAGVAAVEADPWAAAEGLMAAMLPHEKAPCEGEMRAEAGVAAPAPDPPCSTGDW